MNEENETLNKAKLAMKIAEVGNKMRSIKKDGFNANSSYNYISYEEINAHVSKAMFDAKLCIVPNIQDHKKEKINTNNNKVVTTYFLDVKFEIIDAETGYSIDIDWISEGSDYHDKALSKALTEASKRFYAKLFNITSGEIDGDRDTITINEEQFKSEEERQKDSFKSRVENFLNRDPLKIQAMKNTLKKLNVSKISETNELDFFKYIFKEVEKLEEEELESIQKDQK